jgi:iron complex outermembrane receptor protein
MFSMSERLIRTSIVLLVILFGQWMQAQQEARVANVTGIVLDATGAAIPGAHLTLRDAQRKIAASGLSNPEGNFTLPSVPAGSYVLEAECRGFEPAVKDIAVATSSGTTSIRIILKVAGIQQSVTVTAGSTYTAVDASAGTRFNIPLMETPITVQVVPAQVIRDQQNVALVDAITNVSGVAPTNDGYGTADSFSIRGFDIAALIYQDGFKLDQYTVSGFSQDMANVEQVEIVKGPASVLYGQGEPGGLVDVETKKPHDNRSGAFEQLFSHHQYYRTTGDLNQPLAGKTLLSRLVIDGTDAGSFRNFIHTNEFNIYPSIIWRPSHLAEFTVQAAYQTGSDVLDNGIPFLATGVPANVPHSSNFVDVGANKSSVTQYAIKPLLTIHPGEDCPLRLRYKYEYISGPTPLDEVYIGDADPSGNLARFGFVGNYFHHRTNQVLADMPGKFSLGPVKNTFLIGFDFYKDAGAYDYNTVFPQTINIYSPIYDQPIAPADPSGWGYNRLGNNAYGGYIQDLAEFPGKFFVLAGARMNWAEWWEDYAGSYVAKTDVHDRPTNPRAGLLWQANQHVSLYGSYSSNYGDSALGLNAPGQKFLPPEAGDQVEFGAKSEWLDKRLTASTGVYRIFKHNVPAPDPNNPALTIAIGTVRTQGVEFDVAGQVNRDLRVIASYSNLQALTTRDTNFPSQQGLPFGSVPHFMGSLWTTWEPQMRGLRGFKLGVGAQTRSGEQAYQTLYDESYNPLGLEVDRIPSFGIANLMTGYEHAWGRTHISAQVNVNNLFNEKYFSNVNPAQAMPGVPFTVLPAMRIRF